MKRIETEIIIDADPEKVWRVLTDFEQYPAWNPFIESITGGKAEGKNIEVSIKPPGGKSMTFKPTILKFKPNEEFRWKGKLGIKGLFDGEHYFKIKQNDDQQTQFIHGEIFSGALVWIMGGIIHKAEKGFRMMNEAVKKECEKPE